MTLPQPFQYQGSKRALAALILDCFAAGIFVGLLTGCVEPVSNRTVETSGLFSKTETGLSPASPFYDYDKVLVNSITEKWYGILDHRIFRKLGPAKGKVVVQFQLNANGTVSDLRTSYNDVGKMFGEPCEQAVKDCIPFKNWPPGMMKMVGANYRQITFTFYYCGK
jgi:hypothetical protein